MAKYVDADKMLEEYKHSIYDTTDLAEMLNYMPAADVVEVVRCRDCKWFKSYGSFGDCHNPVWGDGWANYPSPTVSEDGFCSYGEKR